MLIEARHVTKYFGSVIALKDVTLEVDSGEIVCLLGDNGAGKSTLIKLLAGVHEPDEGEIRMEGEPITFSSPRDSLKAGIATVYQDLATIPLISVSRNFFCGNEPTKGWGPFRCFDVAEANRVTRDQLHRVGIHLRDPSQPVGTLSGGERQALAIARAMYFGARVLILDEPTSALGVREAATVLRFIAAARETGVGVILISHNVLHAYSVGKRFVVLNRGRCTGVFSRDQVTRDELEHLMAGGNGILDSTT
jgi:simple sugar transport system ATP-binding protein